MPARYSDEHLRLLQMGIPVYPGDEELIAEISGQARTDSARYPNFRGAIAGDTMGGNVTPRFGMDTARQRSTNLGLPKAKRKVVEKITDDDSPNTITTTIEDEVPSQDMGSGERFVRDPIGFMFGYDEPDIRAQERVDTSTGRGPRWADRSGPHPLWGDIAANFPRVISGPVDVASKIVGGTVDVAGNVLEDVGKSIAGLGMTKAEYDKANIDPSAVVEEDITIPSPPVTRTAVAGLPQPTYQEGDVTARIYNNWARDIPTERKEYLRAMKDIYFKMSMLSSIATLVDGEDQSESFGRMQVEMLNYMMETDNEVRLLKIHKGVYFNKDGKWDPPKNERMAHQRAVRFGAGPGEASEFSGFYPKKADTWQNWLVKEKATGKEITMASQGRPEGYDPDLFEFSIVPPSIAAKGKFREYKLQFDAAGNEPARQSVAVRWAREIIRQSGMPIVQPPTETQIQDAYEELRMGKEYEVEDMSGPQD